MHKNKLDQLLEFYEARGKKSTKLEKVYYRPSTLKCIFGFCFSFIFMMLLLFLLGFQFTIMYLFLFLGDGLLLLYYSFNLFSKKGFYLPKYIKKEEDEDDNS